MQIQISVTPEATPNPATFKFNLSQLICDQNLDFPTAQAAQQSPIATKIFGFPWTSGVFVGPNFISVTKQDWVDWEVLAEPLAGLIREHFESGQPALVEILQSEDQDEVGVNDSPTVAAIKRILKNEIRPIVALDGGDVAFSSFHEGVLALEFRGACTGCPSKSVTLKNGIETRIRELLPEVLEVVSTH